MGYSVFNPLVGVLVAVFTGDPQKSSESERSKLLGFHMYSDDDHYFVDTDGLTFDLPDPELETAKLTIPLYARREILRQFMMHEGMNPKHPERELSLPDVQSLIAFARHFLLRNDLSELMLYGDYPVKGSRPSVRFVRDGFFLGAKHPEIPEILKQDRPRDRYNRSFTAGSVVEWKVGSDKLLGTVIERNADRIKISVGVNVDDIHVLETGPEFLSVARSQNRNSTKHLIELGDPAPGSLENKMTFATAIDNNRRKFYDLALDGRLTIKDCDGYSLDMIVGSDGKEPVFQLYDPSGESLGILSSRNESAFDDLAESHLARTFFLDW